VPKIEFIPVQQNFLEGRMGFYLRKSERIVIIQDTREQRPWRFDPARFEVRRGTLKQGDYSVAGFEDRIAIERKNPQDFLGSMGNGRDRFMRELERLAEYEYADIVVDSFDWRRYYAGEYRSKFSDNAILGTTASIRMKYNVHTYIYPDIHGAQTHAEEIFWLWVRRVMEGKSRDPEADQAIARAISIAPPRLADSVS